MLEKKSPGRKQPDKKKVVDEVWDDARVRSFLDRLPYEGAGDADFAVLLRAYQGMRADDFSRFIRFFAEAGHDLNARNARGTRFVDYIARHRLATPFIDIMVGAGAEPPQSPGREG